MAVRSRFLSLDRVSRQLCRAVERSGRAACISARPHRWRFDVRRLSLATALLTVAAALLGSSAGADSSHRPPTDGVSLGITGSSPAVAYSAAITKICAGALLFDSPHGMGTRADALSIADDIRASTARRLDLATAVSVPPELQDISGRWIDSQRRLAALYASTWVRIYDTVDAAHTPTQQAALPGRLEKLVHAPDALKSTARHLELELRIPDCTGGGE